MSASTGISEMWGKEVVFDVVAPYVYVGCLTSEDDRYFVLEGADCHDLRDSSTTREQYVLECRRHGIGVNRRRILVQKDQVISVSKLADVME